MKGPFWEGESIPSPVVPKYRNPGSAAAFRRRTEALEDLFSHHLERNVNENLSIAAMQEHSLDPV